MNSNESASVKKKSIKQKWSVTVFFFVVVTVVPEWIAVLQTSQIHISCLPRNWKGKRKDIFRVITSVTLLRRCQRLLQFDRPNA